MKEVLPIVIICCVGIAFCFVYLAILFFKWLKGKLPRKKVESFEFDENVLTIHLDEEKK